MTYKITLIRLDYANYNKSVSLTYKIITFTQKLIIIKKKNWLNITTISIKLCFKHNMINC